MIDITTTKEGKTAVLLVSGRVDTLTTKSLEAELMAALKKNKSVILDFGDVAYISSAGLRSLLLGHKTAVSKGGEMQLRNSGESVMSVLKSVGFDKVLKII